MAIIRSMKHFPAYYPCRWTVDFVLRCPPGMVASAPLPGAIYY